jgi:hypothetical protein
MKQATNNILMVRPATFAFNTETAGSNAFQSEMSGNAAAIKQQVLEEFDAFVKTLQSGGVTVFVFDDTEHPEKPDAVFPNNWVTFHPDGTVILYPMFAPNRRLERRQDIIDALAKQFTVSNILDLSGYENANRFLEGTGSIVFDHKHKTAYACLSPRTDKALFLQVCEYLQYQPVYFYAHDKNGKEIYHTNVMMCIGENFAVICLDTITNPQERVMVAASLTNAGHQVIDITFEQMNAFAGNMLMVQSSSGKAILALSQSSYNSLASNQKEAIEKYCTLLPLAINTIETIGGGSARCMMAEIFLPAV